MGAVPDHPHTVIPSLSVTPCGDAIDWYIEAFGAERLRDPFGHTWGLAEHVEDVSDAEMARRVEAFYEDNA